MPRARYSPPEPARLLDVDALDALDLSRGREPGPLVDSVRKLGLLRPLWTAPGPGGRPLVIAGSRRLAALRTLGVREAPCVATPEPAGEASFPDAPSRLLTLAVTDNLDRGLNQAELALCWAWARKNCAAAALPGIADLLGFKPRDRRLAALEDSARLPPRALDALAAGRLDLENAGPLMTMDGPEREMVLDLLARTGASRQNRRLWLEWLGDLGRLKGPGGIADILASPELASARGAGGRETAGARLRALRHPRLAELAAKRRDAVVKMALPPGLKIEADPELEDASCRMELVFPDRETLRALAGKALELAGSDELGELWLEDPGPPRS